MPKETLSKVSTRNCNIDILRLIAAVFVMAGHMGHICGGHVPTLLWTPIHTLGVYILFSISGALITKSWWSDPNPVRYVLKRFFRIFPPLVVFTFLMVFVAGPILSSLSMAEYFQNAGTYVYLKNLLLSPVYALPGVFGNIPYAGVVNGSLWTIPVEVAMYCVIPPVVTITCYRKDSEHISLAFVAVVVLVCICDLMVKKMVSIPRVVVWGTDWVQALDVVPFYCIGMLFASPAMKRLLNLKIAVIVGVFALCLAPSLICNRVLLYIFIPYFCFSFAESKPIFQFKQDRRHEISYGIYLYGFFIQQLVVYLFMHFLAFDLPQNLILAISMAVTIGCALLSERYIEQPALLLMRKIVGRFGQRRI